MSKVQYVTDEVVLDGFQAILKEGKAGWGYTLQAVIDKEIVDKLEEQRPELVDWAADKVNSRRGQEKELPWTKVAEDKYAVKFKWKEDRKPLIVDSYGELITDSDTRIYSGSIVKIGFNQKPYVWKDKNIYGSKLELKSVMLVRLQNEAGVDSGPLSTEDVMDMFGKTEGYRVDEPNVTASTTDFDENDEF